MCVDINRLNVVFQRLRAGVLMTCVGVCVFVCLSACGIEEFEMVLWLRGGGMREVFVVVHEKWGAMVGVNLEVRF